MPATPYTISFNRGQSRLFSTMWLLVHLSDALAVTALALRNKLNEPHDPNASMGFHARVCDLAIFLPVINPMRHTVENKRIDTINITIQEISPVPDGHNITAFGEIHDRMFQLVFVLFYERHLPIFQQTFGTETRDWPQMFQFAWAIRNGFVHHAGLLHFRSADYPAVTWRSLTYFPADKGKLILGPEFTSGDLLMLIFDLSDELDARGAAKPTE